MGARGPAPQPAALRILKGNGKDRQPNKAKVARQPMAVPARPPMPADLGEWGVWIWELVTPELVRMGILGQVDHATLEAYCRAYQAWKLTDPDDRRWVQLTMCMVNLGSKLGLDPASRLRMTLPEASNDEQTDVFGARSG